MRSKTTRWFRAPRLVVPALSLLLSLFCSAAQAADARYRVDMIVFLDLWATQGEAGGAVEPNLQNAIELNQSAQLSAQGIEVLPEDQFGLEDEWKHLRYSKQFRPLVKLAWTQKNPPSERGPALLLRSGKSETDPNASAYVEGSVALLLSRYLHLDVDLSYVENGTAWKLDERRRMRRDEVHHLDSARLGVLAKVSKVDGADNDATQ